LTGEKKNETDNHGRGGGLGKGVPWGSARPLPKNHVFESETLQMKGGNHSGQGDKIIQTRTGEQKETTDNLPTRNRDDRAPAQVRKEQQLTFINLD